MREIGNYRPVPEVPKLPEIPLNKPDLKTKPDIEIKPVEDEERHDADRIFDKLCKESFDAPNDSYYEIIEDGKDLNYYRDKKETPEERDKEKVYLRESGKITLKDAEDILTRLFDNNNQLDITDKENNEKAAIKIKEANDESADNAEYEYNEDGTRELTEDEKQYLKDKLGWSDEKIKKCTIDKDGVIHYKTDRCDLEGKTSENGVPYVRRRIEINGVVIEGVFPVFDSVFDTELSPENYKSKTYAKECNEKLKEAVENDPELRAKFTAEQLKDIEEGRTPRGYVWHHNEEPGKMQLVKREDHDKTIGGAAHTGGNSLWGADSEGDSKKGEEF